MLENATYVTKVLKFWKTVMLKHFLIQKRREVCRYIHIGDRCRDNEAGSVIPFRGRNVVPCGSNSGENGIFRMNS